MAKLRPIQALIGFAGPLLCLGLHFVVTLCYINRWDKVTAITVFPLWSWAILCCSILALSWLVSRSKFAIVVAAIWAVTAIIGADEIPGIVNSIKGKKLPLEHPRNHGEKSIIRVATINCKNRSPEALLEVKSYAPDIVLIQESPSGVQLNKIAKQLFGEEGRSAGGWNCGIIARGNIQMIKNSPSPRFVHATLTFDDGRAIDIVSVHLKHAITRWDLWERECWKTHYANRQVRRDELIEILSQVSDAYAARPVIFGGDFNAPASDAVYNILRRHFLDSYRAAGSGWGNTFFNRLPVLRIDQLWATTQLQPINARAIPTKNSDHRLLVCDYTLD